MKLKLFTSILIVFSLLWIGCNLINPEDDTGPTIEIISPADSSYVFQEVLIESISENFDIPKVELWVDSDYDTLFINADSLIDGAQLFTSIWNTTSFTDGSMHFLQAKAFDSNGNSTTSTPVTVFVDNNLSLPIPVSILDSATVCITDTLSQYYELCIDESGDCTCGYLKFENGGFLIPWSKSVEFDFYSYTLEHSTFSDMSEYDSIYSTINVKDTSFFFSDPSVLPVIPHYFRIEITDIFNYSTKGEIATTSLDPYPVPVDVTSVEYDLDQITIQWETNTDTDFENYRLYVSDTQEGDTTFVAEYSGQLQTEHTIYYPNFDPTIENWFSVATTDTLDQTSFGESLSNTQDSPPDTSIITSIIFSVSMFDIQWEQNENEDFVSYTLYEGFNSDMSDKQTIFTSTTVSDTFHQVTGVTVGEKRYYQVEVTDFWGLTTLSEIILADANYWFTLTLGGDELDQAHTVVHTSDGGYVIGGETRSFGDVSTDIWLVKVDSLANTEWEYLLENTSHPDQCFSIIQTQDGGFLLSGTIGELFGTVIHPVLIKLDNSGNEIWQSLPCDFCGENKSYGQSGIQTSDGGYIFTGYTDYEGENYDDLWVIKTDNSGIKEWHFIASDLPDSENLIDQGFDIVEDQGGNFIVTGWQMDAEIENKDVWVLQFDFSGNLAWETRYDWGGNESGSAIEKGIFGYVIAGDISDTGNSDTDMLLFEIDPNGSSVWDERYGGNGDEVANGLAATIDGGFVIAGYTTSYGAGEEDIYVIKTDGFGNTEWTQYYGGLIQDIGEDIQQTFEGEGGYIISGSTRSFGAGNWDYWLIKTNSTGQTSPY